MKSLPKRNCSKRLCFLACSSTVRPSRTGVIDVVACAALRRPYQICGTYGLKYLVAVAVTIIGFLCVSSRLMKFAHGAGSHHDWQDGKKD